MMSPVVLLLYGPSGVGKTSVLRHLEEVKGFDVAKKFTTRKNRGTPDDDRDFIFLPPDAFPTTGLAVFETYGHKFGVQLDAVAESLAHGRSHAIVVGTSEIVRQIRSRFGAAVICMLIWCDRKALQSRAFSGDSARSHRWSTVEHELVAMYDELNQINLVLDNSGDFGQTTKKLDRLLRLVETSWSVEPG